MKIKIKTLDKNYHENDEIILHACMGILENFIEDECGGSDKFYRDNLAKWRENCHENYEDSYTKFCEKAKSDKFALFEIYHWWKSVKREGLDWSSDNYETSTKMLARLMEARGVMWT